MNIKFQEIESKAFSKSTNIKRSGILLYSVKCIISKTSLIFSPINLPFRNPVWSLFINLLRTVFILSAMQTEASLYIIFNRLIGRQFFKKCLGFPVFGNCSCLYESMIARVTKIPISFPKKTLKIHN